MIASVRPADLAKPTPCTEWDVRTLINHMIGVCQGFNAALRGEAPPPGNNAASGGAGGVDLVGDDPAAAYGAAADAVLEAWRMPGALDKKVTLMIGEIPAAVAVRIMTGDQTIHTWDLAKALGRPHTMDEELAANTFELMQQFNNPDMRGPGKPFAQPVAWPEDAPVHERLLALSGRQP